MLVRKGVSKKVVVITVIVAIAILALAYSRLSGMFVASNTSYDNFAKCLTEKGVKLYGASWCGHCSNQKKMFGDSFKYIDYVECSENESLCVQAGVKAFPTWFIDGKLYEGVKSINELSSLTGCKVS